VGPQYLSQAYPFDLPFPIYYITYYHIIKPLTHKGLQMAEQLDPNELVSFRELLISNTIQLDVVSRVLIEKGIITNEEFFTKLKEVQMEYKSKDDA
jgi:hypothetical protein